MKKFDYDKEKNLYDYLRTNAIKYPDELAVVDKNKEISFLQLDQYSNAFANYLTSKGIKEKSRIAVVLPRTIDLIIALYAVIKCGCAYVPINPDYPKARIEYIIENADCKAIICDRKMDLWDSIIKVNFRDMDVEKCSYQFECKRNLSEDISYVIYTSGTSGVPKGVMIKQHSVINLIESINRQYHIDHTTKGLCITSVTFDLSVYDIFGVLAKGGCIYLANEEEVSNMKEIKEILVREKINFWNSVPTTMVSLINTYTEQEKNVLPDMRNVFLSGDWIIPSSVIRMQELMPNAIITSLGGATEATVWSIYYDIDHVCAEWSSIPYGKALDNQEIYILDETMSPVQGDAIGELYIGGVGVAEGYVNSPKKTAQAFVSNPFDENTMYRTGDFGRLMIDGNVEFLGRADAQVKIRGFRVELIEVEKKIMEFPAIRAVVVDAIKNGRGDKFICAYIQTKKSFDLYELKQFLKQNLQEYMLPSMFIKMIHLPLSTNGKIDKRKLPKPSKSNLLTERQYTNPKNETEQVILELWKKILNFQEIGVEFDFFEIGGTSLDCIMLEHEMNQSGFLIKYQDLVDFPTIRQQATIVLGLEPMIMKSDCMTKETKYTYEVEEDTDVKVIPFNRLYYRNCFYNSLFSMLLGQKKNINYVFVNDAITYGIKEIETFSCLCPIVLERKPVKQILKEYGINAKYYIDDKTEKVFERIDDVLQRDGYAIMWIVDLCQYFGHKKLNFFSLHSINTERKIIKLQEPHLQPAVGFYNPVHCASFCGYTKTQYIQRELF